MPSIRTCNNRRRQKVRASRPVTGWLTWSTPENGTPWPRDDAEIAVIDREKLIQAAFHDMQNLPPVSPYVWPEMTMRYFHIGNPQTNVRSVVNSVADDDNAPFEIITHPLVRKG